MKIHQSLRLNSIGLLACLATFFASSFNHAAVAVDSWSGAPVSALWNNAANWTTGNTPPTTGDSLNFGASSQTTLTNDLTNPAFVIRNISFAGDAAAYTISGNDFTLGDTTFNDAILVNYSSALQTINNNLTLSDQQYQYASLAGGDVTLGGNISSAGSQTGLQVLGNSGRTLTIKGTANISNRFAVVSGLTLKIDGGSLSSDAWAQGDGTVQVTNGGSLTVKDLYGTPHTLNQDSGTVNLTSGGTVQYLTLNTTGGTANIAGQLYEAININASGSAVVNDTYSGNQALVNYTDNTANGTITVSDNASVTFANAFNLASGSTTATGTINLNGGVLTIPALYKGQTNSATAVNFNGGKLRFSSTNTVSTMGNTTFNVLAGGAVIDTQSFNVALQQPLLSGSANGGLTKQGSGTLTLTGNNTYTGATNASVGTLVVAVGGSINTSSVINVAAGATFENASGAVVTPALNLNEGASLLTSSAGSAFTATSLTLTGNLSDGWTAISLTASAGDGLIKDGALVFTLSGITAGLYDLTSGSAFSGSFDSATVNGIALTLVGQDFTGTNIGGYDYFYTNSTNQLLVTAAVPEPSTWVLLAASGALFVTLRRRRLES